MAGAVEGADLTVVQHGLCNNMLFLSMEAAVNIHILKRLLGPVFKFCRSIYLVNRMECVLDIVPLHSDTLDQIKSFAGVNEYRKRQFKVRITPAEELYGPEFFHDYAFALTTRKVPPSLTKKFLLLNDEWIELRVRRDSNSSVSTYPPLSPEDKGESESDITSINLNDTQEEEPQSAVESDPIEQSESEAEGETEPNNIETVTSPVNEPEKDVAQTSSSEEEHEDTAIQQPTVNPPTEPISDFIPNVCTPSSPWPVRPIGPVRPGSTGHTPERDPAPLTPRNPFKDPGNQPLFEPQIPLIPAVPKTPVQPPIDPNARKTPLHKPKYTPSHPKQPLPTKSKPETIPIPKDVRPKEPKNVPFILKDVQEGFKGLPSFMPSIASNPIGKTQVKPPPNIHSPPRRFYPPVPEQYYPDYRSNLRTEPPQLKTSDTPSPKSEDINIPIVNQAIQRLSSNGLKSLITMLMIQFKEKQKLEDVPPETGSDQVFCLGGKVGVDGGCEEPGLDSDLETQTQLPPNPKPNPTSTPHNNNQPTLQLSDSSVQAANNSVSYPELQTSLQAMTEGLLKAALKEGVLRHDTPKLHEFTGKPEDGKASWRRWELQVKGLQGAYSDRAIKEAMNKALQGDAAIVADSLADDCTWIQLLNAFES